MQINNNKKFIEINDLLKKKDYKRALDLSNKLEKIGFKNIEVLKIKNHIFLKTKKWHEYRENNIKLLSLDLDRKKIKYNIGLANFNLGNLKEALKNFIDSLDIEPKNFNSHISIGLTYKLLGNFEEAIIHFHKAQILANENPLITQNIIDCFNYVDLTNVDFDLVKLNNKIKNQNYNFQKINDLNLIKEILDNSEKIIINNLPNIFVSETQIFRKDSLNLNCKRHMNIFNKHNIIPEYCFGCFKIQISIKDVVNLIKLYFLFNIIQLNKNTFRKCMIELRNNVGGFYKGYVYVASEDEAKLVSEYIKLKISNEKIEILDITIKRGCSEYYTSYPLFKKLKLNVKDKIYQKEWKLIEKNYDIENHIFKKKEEEIFSKTLNQFNLSDFLVIKNWLIYAEYIGDYSFKKIFSSEIKSFHFKSYLKENVKKNF